MEQSRVEDLSLPAWDDDQVAGDGTTPGPDHAVEFNDHGKRKSRASAGSPVNFKLGRRGDDFDLAPGDPGGAGDGLHTDVLDACPGFFR